MRFMSQKALYLLSLHNFGPRIVGLLVPIFQLASSNPAYDTLIQDLAFFHQCVPESYDLI